MTRDLEPCERVCSRHDRVLHLQVEVGPLEQVQVIVLFRAERFETRVKVVPDEELLSSVFSYVSVSVGISMGLT